MHVLPAWATEPPFVLGTDQSWKPYCLLSKEIGAAHFNVLSVICYIYNVLYIELESKEPVSYVIIKMEMSV